MAKETSVETPTEPTMAQVMARMADIQEQQLKVAREGIGVQQQQARQTKRKSNDFGPLISPFNPRGEKDFPMPLLKCEVWYQFKMTPELHSLDREELELMNLIEPGQFTIEMNDGGTQQVCITGKANEFTGGWDSLMFRGPKDEDGNYTGLFTQEKRNRFQSTKNILRQILGDKAKDVMTMTEEKRRIKLPKDHPDYLPISQGE